MRWPSSTTRSRLAGPPVRRRRSSTTTFGSSWCRSSGLVSCWRSSRGARTSADVRARALRARTRGPRLGAVVVHGARAAVRPGRGREPDRPAAARVVSRSCSSTPRGAAAGDESRRGFVVCRYPVRRSRRRRLPDADDVRAGPTETSTRFGTSTRERAWSPASRESASGLASTIATCSSWSSTAGSSRGTARRTSSRRSATTTRATSRRRRRSIRAARECGADAVKLQKRDNARALHARALRRAVRQRALLRPHVRRAP